MEIYDSLSALKILKTIIRMVEWKQSVRGDFLIIY